MLTEVMEYYGLVKEFRRAGYYETAHQKQLFKDIKAATEGVTRRRKRLTREDVTLLR